MLINQNRDTTISVVEDGVEYIFALSPHGAFYLLAAKGKDWSYSCTKQKENFRVPGALIEAVTAYYKSLIVFTNFYDVEVDLQEDTSLCASVSA